MRRAGGNFQKSALYSFDSRNWVQWTDEWESLLILGWESQDGWAQRVEILKSQLCSYFAQQSEQRSHFGEFAWCRIGIAKLMRTAGGNFSSIVILLNKLSKVTWQIRISTHSWMGIARWMSTAGGNSQKSAWYEIFGAGCVQNLAPSWFILMRPYHTCKWAILSLHATYGWVVSHMWMSNLTRVNESYHAYRWVMSCLDASPPKSRTELTFEKCKAAGRVIVIWLIYISDMTHFICGMWHSCVCYDSFMCMIWLFHICAMTHLYVWYDSFICVMWLIHMGDMTHSYVWQESSIYIYIHVYIYRYVDI